MNAVDVDGNRALLLKPHRMNERAVGLIVNNRSIPSLSFVSADGSENSYHRFYMQKNLNLTTRKKRLMSKKGS